MTGFYGQSVIEFDPHRYVWEQVAEIVEERIRSGEYPPHQRLTEVALAQEFGVARETVRRALGHLREKGLIVTLLGKGSFPKPPAAQGNQPEGES